MHERATSDDSGPAGLGRAWVVDDFDDVCTNQQRPDSAASLAHRMTQTHDAEARKKRSSPPTGRLETGSDNERQ